MSAFLAPIHFNVFEKIKNQKQIVENLINDFGDDSLREKLYKTYGEVPEGDLEDIIDLKNIHGWLQDEFIKTEKSLSFVVNELLENNINIDDLKRWFKNQGENFKGLNSPNEIFITFSTFYMDGMPCDRAITPIDFNEKEGSWQLNNDLHKSYWKDEGFIYNQLRNSWLEGLANSNGYDFKFENNIYEVKKCTV